MNNKEAWKKFLLEKMRIGTSGEEIFNAGFNAGQAALASQAQQDHIGGSNKLALPIIDTDSAREFLIANVISKFSDSTFQSYVRNELAGDFAYQLARYFQAQYPSWLLKSTQDLAMHLWKTHYKAESPVFEVLNDLAGVISQIDNMTTGLVRLQPQAQQEPEPFQLPANDTVLNILARPNFACGGLAQRLRKLGHSIPTKAEDEQAHVLFWMLNLYLKHGENWAQVGNEYLATPPAPEGEHETN